MLLIHSQESPRSTAIPRTHRSAVCRCVSLWGARAARGLMHADVRLDNFFFPAGEQGGLLDFQLIKKGCVVDDIA